MRDYLLVLAGTISVLFLAGCDVRGDPLLVACEDALKDRLKAPSTYKRIAKHETIEMMDEGKFYKYLVEKDEPAPFIVSLIDKFRSGAIKPNIFEISIEYDADNSFGVPLRGAATCTYTSDDGERPGRSDTLKYFVKIDGMDRIEWLKNQLQP